MGPGCTACALPIAWAPIPLACRRRPARSIPLETFMSASFTKSDLKWGKIKPLDSHAWALGWVSRPTCHRDPEAQRPSEKTGTVGDAEAGANPPAPDRANPEDPS